MSSKTRKTTTMSHTRKFFSNIVSHRDNGQEIELNIWGTHYHDPGQYSGPYEDCYPAETETTVTDCKVIATRKGTSKVWARSVDFYEFSESEQERFLEKVLQEMEFE